MILHQSQRHAQVSTGDPKVGMLALSRSTRMVGTQRAVIPGGKLGQVFVEVSKLPRRQQDKVIEFVEAFVEKKAVGDLS